MLVIAYTITMAHIMHLSDMELCHVLCQADDSRPGYPAYSFIRNLGGIQRSVDGKYIPCEDIVSQTIFPFLMQLDRLRLRGIPNGKERNDIVTAMISALHNNCGPYPTHLSSRIDSGHEPMTAISVRINPYRQMLYEKEQAKKAEEAQRKAEADRAQARAHAFEELGEIRKIGSHNYIVKNGAVFKLLPSPVAISYMPTNAIPLLRGPLRFESIAEAEAFEVSREEACLLAEAKRRLVAEKKAALTSDREARITSIMEKLRKESSDRM